MNTLAKLNLQEVVERVKEQLASRGIEATGALFDSVRAEINENVLSIKYADYGDVVDSGRQPGSMPPVDAISQWMDTKGIGGGEQIAWAIATSIKNEGIEAKPWKTEVVNDIVKEILVGVVEEMVAEEIERDFLNQINNIL